jgi:hypothetical protein
MRFSFLDRIVFVLHRIDRVSMVDLQLQYTHNWSGENKNNFYTGGRGQKMCIKKKTGLIPSYYIHLCNTNWLSFLFLFAFSIETAVYMNARRHAPILLI